MKKIILGLVMGLGLVNFAQAEEECVQTKFEHLTTEAGKCDVVNDVPHVYVISAICRNRIGGRVQEKKRTCEAMQGMDSFGFEDCAKYAKKLPKGKLKSCAVNEQSEETIASVKNAWKKKVCFIGTYGDCRGGGKQTKDGCEIGDTTSTSFFYDSGCTIAKAGSVETRTMVPAPGGFGTYADPRTSGAKEKKLDTTPIVQPPKNGHGGFGAPAEAGSAK